LETYELLFHPANPPLAVSSVQARILAFDANWLTLRWRVEGAAQVSIPAFAGKRRADGLWQTTCFELFVKPDGGDAYVEFNLSPSQSWAAYDFIAYREGMAERSTPRDPVCTPRRGQSVLIFDAAIPAAILPPMPWAYGLSAVIEEEGGRKSYWAIAHREDKPDFHSEACFAAMLAAPAAP
jgi:hypothetical protein